MLNKLHFLINISNKHLFVLKIQVPLFPVMILVSKEPFVGVDYISLFTAALRGKANKRSVLRRR